MSKTPADTRAAYPHFHEIATRWMDNDFYGHVNNVIYYSYFDTAVNQYLIRQGALDPARADAAAAVRCLIRCFDRARIFVNQREEWNAPSRRNRFPLNRTRSGA